MSAQAEARGEPFDGEAFVAALPPVADDQVANTRFPGLRYQPGGLPPVVRPRAVGAAAESASVVCFPCCCCYYCAGGLL